MNRSEPSKAPRNYRLSLRLLFYIILCSSIFTVVGAAIQLYDDYTKDLDEIYNNLDYISSAYSEPLAASLWDVNHDQVIRTLEGVMKLPGVVFLNISELKGSTHNNVTALGVPPEKNGIVRELHLSYGPTQIPVGSLTVIASTQKVIQRLKERILIILVTQGLKTFIVSLCIFFIFQYLIMRHLVAITDYFKHFNPERPELPLAIHRNPVREKDIDLFELLIRSINQMRLKLLESLEQRQVYEDELRQLKNQLKSIIDNMPALLIGVDANGCVNQWNREAQNISRISEAEALGNPLTTVLPFMTDHAEILEKARSSRSPVKLTEVIRHDGQETTYWDIMVYPLLNQAPANLVIRLENVTERFKFNQVLIQNEKMITVGKLSSGMAHEINNPLGGMIQNAQVISNRILRDLPENDAVARELGTSMESIRTFLKKRKIMTHLNLITEAGQRAASVVNNMLRYVKKTNAPKTRFDVTQLLDKTLEIMANDFKRSAAFSKIKVIKNYAPGLPPVSCDGNSIQQVFLNILKNGAEAMAGSDHPEFTLNAYPSDSAVCIEVRDNGPGMPPDVQQKIFEPFFSTKPVDQGTGLGLYVCYMIITQNHQGTLEVASKVNQGTCFTIHLPLQDEQTPSTRL